MQLGYHRHRHTIKMNVLKPPIRLGLEVSCVSGRLAGIRQNVANSHSNIIIIIVTAIGKLPVKVDMNYIPQPQVEREDPSNKGPGVATESAPPRIPPKMNKSAKNPAPGNAVPALPPKPKAY